MELAFVIEKFALAIAIFAVSLGVAAYSTLAERKIAAFLQGRVGPHRAGWGGMFQPLADGGKMFFKEEIIPSESNAFLFIAGPSLALLTALIGSAVIPWGQPLTFGDASIELQVTDVNVGILYIFGVVSLGVYGVMIGGWASNNKFSLMGAIRAASQNISYEIPMGLSIIALLMVTQTLSLKEIAAQQSGFWSDGWFSWMVFKQPLGFLIFLICAFAECNRTPFDLPESENELVGGYHTEYSGFKLGAYLFAEYINMFVSGAVMSTLYFGGYNFPFMNDLGLPQNVITILGVLFLFGKIFFFIFFFMWVRWTVPRFRYDQLMNLGWKVLIPLGIANIVLTGIWIVVKDIYFK
ncbi:MAG: NADH-quinone oxidoreductase subunit NuoH [Pyrinomonadaceae bacterium]|nr:NADH-quinone oxidoreductase subunit NuoH [Sphingobacteriaceae bacterium]